MRGREGWGVTAAGARARGTATLLDVVVPRGADDPVKALRPVLPHVDCFLPNEDEARLVTGHDNPADQARALLGLGCASVVITCGAEGAVYADPARLIRVRPLPVEVVDGSGAGDAFTAGIILVLWQLHPSNTVVIIPMIALFALLQRYWRGGLLLGSVAN